MASSSASDEVDYWPGYVDALTSMVKVLTFIMMLLALTVSVISQQIAVGAIKKLAETVGVDIEPGQHFEQIVEKINEEVAKQLPPKTPAPPAKPVLSGAPEEGAPTTRTASNTEGTEASSGAEKGSQSTAARIAHAATGPQKGSAHVTENGEQTLILKFDELGVKLEAEGKAAVEKFVKRLIASGANRFAIRAAVSSEASSITGARRLAYHRMMIVRQAMLDAGLASEFITMLLDDPRPNVVPNIISIEAH